MRNLQILLLAVATIAALCFSASAQGRRASLDAAIKWQTAAAKAGSSNTDLRAIGVAAQRTATGIDVNIAVLADANFASAGTVSYSVQAVSVVGSQTLRLGKPAQITSSSIEQMAADANGIVATPRITIADLAEANAVEITVKGLIANGVQSIVVPLSSEINTAALGWNGTH